MISCVSFYLGSKFPNYHRKRWSFMKEFIIHGGLETLAALIDSENLYLRGQVLEVLLCATDCDTFDWFRHADSFSDKQLHSKLLNLGRSPVFLRKLLNNRTGSYPGGSFRALQLIAFTLSWIRALYTADQKLQLSVTALEELRLWSASALTAAGTSAVESKEETEVDPEAQLAKTLLDDFGGELNAPSGAAGAGVAAGTILATTIDDRALSEVHNIDVKNSNSVIDSTVHVVVAESVEELKNQGNDQFKAGRFEDAVSRYRAALHLLAGAPEGSTQKAVGALEPSLHSNIATAWWKVVQDCLLQQPVLELYLSLAPAADSTLGENAVHDRLVSALEACAAACRAALSRQASHSKAAYRLASELLLRQAPQAALEVVERCIEAIRAESQLPAGASDGNAGSAEDLSGEGVSGDTSTSGGVEMLLQVKRRCVASLLLAERDARKSGAVAGSGAHGLSSAQLGLTGKTGEILRALLVQHQIELDLPVEQRVTRTVVQASADSVLPQIVHVAKKGEEPSTEAVKPKKKKKVVTGTSSVARKLQEIDDNMLDALMKRSSIKS